jgi:hypothetical protein
MEIKKTVLAARIPSEIVEHRAVQATKTFESLWRYAMIRLLCIFGIHWEGIVVSGNLGCCTLCGEDTYAVFIVHKLERNAHGRILPRN